MSFIPQEIIRKKRDAENLTSVEIDFFVKGIADNSITEGQVAAFAMAVFFNDLSVEERVAMTRSMWHSGESFQWKENGIDGYIVDKHSTGGVGDKVTLPLMPLMACFDDIYVPSIAGRGLGHTGGTIDKLESIPGYKTKQSMDDFLKIIKEIKCGIMSQTAEIAPADSRLYKIRDVTATTQSLSLITASILSKKFAETLDFLVMDVKYGSGSFLGNYENSKTLAESIVNVANGAGVKTVALMSDMNQVLGKFAGNALEVKESVDVLLNKPTCARQKDLIITLAAVPLAQKKGISLEKAKEEAAEKLASGQPAEIFGKMVAAFGGPVDFIENIDAYMPKANYIKPLYSNIEGYVEYINVYELGMSIIDLKGGRRKVSDEINHAVGLEDVVVTGSLLTKDKPLAIIHADTEEEWLIASERIQKSIKIGNNQFKEQKIIEEIIYPS